MPIEKGSAALKSHLLANSGIQGLEILKPSEIDRAVGLFDRDGFVVIEDVLATDELALLQSGVADAVAEITALDPEGSGNRGAKRYSFGGSSLTRSQLHRPAWQMLLSVEPVIQLLDAIFGNPDYALRSARATFACQVPSTISGFTRMFVTGRRQIKRPLARFRTQGAVSVFVTCRALMSALTFCLKTFTRSTVRQDKSRAPKGRASRFQV